jgi:glycine cleavage system H protein
MSPVAGVIIEINEDVEDDAGLVNSGPYEEGWLLRIEIEDASQLEDLMSAEDYEEYIGTLEDE